jgi:hypothetical protein
MKRMAASNVLIVGMQGLGVEIGALVSHPNASIGLIFVISKGPVLGWCQVCDDL